MTATTFNTLAAARELKAAGITKADLADFATKADIRWILTILGFQSAFILAIAAKLFGIV